MGGFLSALGALATGAGQQAGPWRDRKNEENLRIWESTKKAGLDAIDGILGSTIDPAVHSRAMALKTKMASLAPGDKNQPKILEELQSLTTLHPEIEGAFAKPEPQTKPGMSAGVVPGRPIEVAEPPNAAQPGTSLVSPGAAGGMTGGAASMPEITPGPMEVSASAPAGSGSSTFDRLRQMTSIPPALMKLNAPLIENELAINRDMLKLAAEDEAKRLQQLRDPFTLTPGSARYVPDATGKPSQVASVPFQERGPMALPTGSRLVNPATGKVLVEPTEDPKPGSAFQAAYAAKKKELGRELNAAEIATINQSLSREPLYQIVAPEGGTVYGTRGQAIGAPAPRTTYDLSGMPVTAGQPGVAMSPPPQIDASTQNQLATIKQARDISARVNTLLQNPKYATLGPAAGRLKVFEAEKIGGAGATKEQVQMAVALKRLLQSEVFRNAGKAVTIPELGLTAPVVPALSDTLESAIVKTKELLDFYSKAYEYRTSMMSPRQRGQVPTVEEFNKPSSGAGGSSGKTWKDYLNPQ